MLAAERPGGGPLFKCGGVRNELPIRVGGRAVLRVADTLIRAPEIRCTVIRAQQP